MNVLYVSEIFPDQERGVGVWGGGEKQFYEVARRIARMGHRVSVLTSRFPGQPAKENCEGMEVIRTGLPRDPATGRQRASPVALGSYLARTIQAGVGSRPEIVHCNGLLASLAGKGICVPKGVPMVSTVHDVWSFSESLVAMRSPLEALLGYSIGPLSLGLRPTTIIAVSPQVKSKLLALGLRPQVVRVIPNGVDWEEPPGPTGGSEGGPVVYVGRLVKSKRVDWLVASFARVHETVPEARLLVVGGGPELSTLRAVALKLGLEGAVDFTGLLPKYSDVSFALKSSSVFATASLVEGEGISVKEAMAAGLPIVAAVPPLSGVRSVVSDGENGYLTKPEDSQLFAERLTSLLTDRRARARMGAAARKSMEGHGWDEVARQTLEVYLSARLEARAAAAHSWMPSSRDIEGE